MVDISHIYMLFVLLWSPIVAAHTKMRIQFNWANFFFAFFVFLIQKNLFIFDSLLLSRDLTMKLLSMAKIPSSYFFFISFHLSSRDTKWVSSWVIHKLRNHYIVLWSFLKYKNLSWDKFYWHNLCVEICKG